MNYHIHITQAAERDLNNAADYIDLVLKNPTAADHLLDLTEEKISNLATFPEKFPLVQDEVLASWGIRFTVINNYLAFYLINEPSRTVYIVRFLYRKSNWAAILKTGLSLD